MSDRKVHFSVPIHQVEYLDKQWETASRLARDGSDWLRMGLDRQRFRDRIERTGEILNRILDYEFRQQIYKERFENFVTDNKDTNIVTTSATSTTTTSSTTESNNKEREDVSQKLIVDEHNLLSGPVFEKGTDTTLELSQQQQQQQSSSSSSLGQQQHLQNNRRRNRAHKRHRNNRGRGRKRR